MIMCSAGIFGTWEKKHLQQKHVSVTVPKAEAVSSNTHKNTYNLFIISHYAQKDRCQLLCLYIFAIILYTIIIFPIGIR